MDDLLADFLAETREMLEAIETEIVAWEHDPSDRTRLGAIFRFVHTVKGNCGFFDFPRLARLSHAAEDALADCRAGRRDPDAALVSAVLAIIDRIGEISQAIEAGEELTESGDDRLIEALESSDLDMGSVTPRAAAEAGTDKQRAGEKEAGENPAVRQAVQRSIRLPVDLLDEVMKGVSDLVLARNDLARRLRDLGTRGDHSEAQGAFDRLSTILSGVREGITRMRMQRLEHLFSALPRLVRDLSAELGKQVMVDFEGGDVELDREMIELIRDPITHIIRNAIDHGIETPADRLKANKREIGLMRFAARQSGNEIVMVISDDGAGIDAEQLCAKALAAGLYSEQELARMSHDQKLELIFEAGLSTAEEISEISGRGVGMDVVRSNVEKIGGSIAVSSEKGTGTVFELHLPLTLSIMPALSVVCEGQLYALPQSYVEEIVFANASGIELTRAGDRLLVKYRGKRVPCISLQSVLGFEEPQPDAWQAMTLVLIGLATGEIFALAVDRVHNHEEVVVKPIAPAIMATGVYAGSTLLDDGQPMLLLDIRNIGVREKLVGEARKRARTSVDEGGKADAKPTVPVMLFTAIDGRKRAVRLEAVARIDTVERSAIHLENDEAHVVLDGRIVPLAGHDGSELAEERYRLLRLEEDGKQIAFLASEVHDTGSMDEDLAPAGQSDLAGTSLIDNQPVSVLDVRTLIDSKRHAIAGSRAGENSDKERKAG